MKKIQGLIIAIVTVMLIASCSVEKGTDSASQASSPTVTQAPFTLPSGYQAVETASFKFAIPKDWTLQKGDSSDSLIFLKDGKEVGQTELLGLFNSETWMNIKPNHSDQTDFQEVKSLISIGGVDAPIYRIQLIHTKPAAENDPDWKYEETRWYVAVKENDRSYGFYFGSDQVDESTMKTILSSFRLNF